MSGSTHDEPASPCKGEVDRQSEATQVGRGSRFSRTKPMTSRARHLRRNLTDAESKLWKAIRRDSLENLHFRRQHPIGPYTLDFYCPATSLAIELDGGQHAEESKAADNRRTAWLANKNIVVVRYWNTDVLKNLPGVLSDLVEKIRTLQSASIPTPALPLAGGGGRPSLRQREWP